MGDALIFKRTVAVGFLVLAVSFLSSWAAEDSLAPEPAKLVTDYALTSASSHDAKDPANWRLVASSDGGRSWVLLDVRTNQVFTARSQRKIFSISNRTAYPIYRLIVSSVLETRLGELELIGPATNVLQETDLEVVRTSSGPHLVTMPGTTDDATVKWMDSLSDGRCSWVQYEYDCRASNAVTEVSLAGYALTSANDTPGRDPCDWRLLGSYDEGKTWVVLDQRQNEIFTNRFQRREFTLAQPARCGTFRFQIDSVLVPAVQSNSMDAVQLADIKPILESTNDEGRFTLSVSAHGENPPYEIATGAFDGKPETKWLDYAGKTDPEHNSSWIQWQYSQPARERPTGDLGWLEGHIVCAGPARIVTSYALTSASSAERPDPANWQLAGSNDGGASWETLDVQTAQTFTNRSQRREFHIPNRKAYGAYRLTTTGSPSVTVAELELIGPAVNAARASDLAEVISASGEQPVVGPAKQAFDHDPATKWLGLGNGNDPIWIQCQYVSHPENLVTKVNQIMVLSQRLAANSVLDDEQDVFSKLHAASRSTREITSYALTSANDHSERDPRDWRLLGMNEDGTWATLDERHNESFSRRFQRRQFTVANPGSYAIYRLQINSIRSPSGLGGDSVQLAEIEPVCGSGGNDDAFSMVVSAKGENPPLETIDSVFDGDLESKWLDFISSTGETNRASWIQWQYIPRVKEQVINQRWLQGAKSLSTEPTRLRLNGIVASWNSEENLLGLLDESGFQFLKLAGTGFAFDPGESIRIDGRLNFENGTAVVQAPEVTRLGRISQFDELHLDAAFAVGQKFASSTVAGSVSFISEDSEQAGFRMNRDGGGSLLVRILNIRHMPRDIFVPGCRFRAQGIVQPVVNQKLQSVTGVMWVSDMDHIQLECEADQDWQKWPEYSLATLRQPTVTPPLMARVLGTVIGQRPGEGVTISDGTNLMFIATRQTNTFSPETAVEVLGFLTKSNGQPTLYLAQVRPAPKTNPLAEVTVGWTTESVTPIRTTREWAQSRQTNAISAKIRGVITYIDLGYDEFYVQDGTGGTIIGNQMGAGIFPFLQQEGMYVEIQAVHNPGDDGLGAIGLVRVLGRGQLPEPRRRSWDTLMTGNDADQWVEIEGLVSMVEKQRFTLTVVGGKITVLINKWNAQFRGSLLGSRVRVRGVSSPLRNNRDQILGLRLLVPADDCVEIVDAAPIDLFDLPSTPIGAVMGSDAGLIGLARIIKTSGVVTYKDQLLLFVQEGGDALRVLLRKDVEVQPGDRVEIAGLPEPDGFSPRLIQAVVRKVAAGALPPATPIDFFAQNTSQCDATRCQIDATFLGHSPGGTEPTLSLQDDKTRQMFCAYLPSDTAMVSLPPQGSRVRLQGVFKAKTDAVMDVDQTVSAFEMYVNSPADMTVLERPSWWSAAHTFWVLTGLGLVLSFSLGWIRLLRKQVQQQTHELREEIDQRKRAEIQVEKAYQELIAVSRQAGMAEIATNVLHNVGNVLNSVNVSGLLIADKLRNSKVLNLRKVAGLVRAHDNDVGSFFASDPKGKQIPEYLTNLAAHLTQEQEGVLREVGSLVSNIDHIKEIVAMQQNYAKASGVIEPLKIKDLVEDAIRLNSDSILRHNVKLVRDFVEVPTVLTDKHKVIQILVNLLRNAKHACTDSDREEKQIKLRVTGQNGRVQISVIDNGIGIPRENLTRIFGHGFTTRKDGHGFGLHSGANAAKEIGGTLGVFSKGPGCGATFTLELPLQYHGHESHAHDEPPVEAAAAL